MRKTNKPQNKICRMFVICLLLFSSGLNFISEVVLIWFHKESLILCISTEHLVYFLFEYDMAEVYYRSLLCNEGKTMGNFIKLVLFKWNIVIIPGMWMCFLGVVITYYILENSLTGQNGELVCIHLFPIA